MHCNVFLATIFNKQFRQLITISPNSLTMLKASTNAKFLFIEVWFTDQNNTPIEIEHNVNIKLIIEIGYINEVFSSAKRTKIH